MITVKSNLDQMSSTLNEMVWRYIPEISAITLTKVAKHAQFSLQGEAKGAFKNTTPWYNQASPIGFKVTPAKPGSLSATVYSNAYFLPRQIKGDLRVARKGDLAIPSYGARAADYKQRWSGAPRKSRGLFRAGQELYKRPDKEKELWYVLRPAARGTRLFHFFEVIKKVVKRSYHMHEAEAAYQVLSRKKNLTVTKSASV